MNLFLVRHAIAVAREEFDGSDDALRPLTKRGRERMRLAVKGLRRILPGIDILATSPLVRARETAEIIAAGIPSCPQPSDVEALIPEANPLDLAAWLGEQENGANIVAVGHEPSLALATSWLLAGVDGPFLSFKKGGVCRLSFDEPPGPASASLLWLLTPRQLRRMSRS